MRSKRSPELRVALPARGWAQATPRRRRRRRSTTAAAGARAASSRPAFVELPSAGLVGPARWPHDTSPGLRTGMCRLVVETPGARLSVELDHADLAVVEAVCRLVLGGRMSLGGATP